MTCASKIGMLLMLHIYFLHKSTSFGLNLHACANWFQRVQCTRCSRLNMDIRIAQDITSFSTLSWSCHSTPPCLIHQPEKMYRRVQISFQTSRVIPGTWWCIGRAFSVQEVECVWWSMVTTILCRRWDFVHLQGLVLGKVSVYFDLPFAF